MKKNEKIENKGNCSLLSVMIVLFLVFIILLSGVLFIKSKIKMPSFANSSSTENLDQSIKKQLSNQSGESVVTIRITESELSTILNTDSKDFPLKNPLVKITPDNIIITGKTGNSPLAFKVSVGIVPRVENGKIVLDIKDVKTGGVSAPKVVTDAVNKNLSNYLSNININNDITVTDVKLYQGYLTATGERK